MQQFQYGTRFILAILLSISFLLGGCGDSRESFVFTNTNPIPEPDPVVAPLAVNDSFNALGNATLNQAAVNGVLVNDTLNGGEITDFEAVGSQGGTVDLKADGSFTYTPEVGFVGAETFTYTLSNSAGDSTATVTLTSTGLGLFVDNSAGPNGDGSQADPFDTLADAIAVATDGDTIFVSVGDGSGDGLDGAIFLPPGVDLIGEGAGLVVAQSIVEPGQSPTLTGPITCGGDNTVSGFIIDGSATEAVIINGVGDVTVSENTFRNSTDDAIKCDDVTGTISIEANIFEATGNNTTRSVDIANTDTNSTLNINENDFLDTDLTPGSSNAVLIRLRGTSETTINAMGNLVTGGTAGSSFNNGIELDTFDTSVTTANYSGNEIDNVNNRAFAFDNRNDSQLTVTMINNILDESRNRTVEIHLRGNPIVSATMTGNTLSNSVNSDGLDADVDGNGTLTLVMENNTITNNANEGIEADATDSGTLKLALRDNTITGNGLDLDLGSNAAGSTVCADITGNQAGTFRFDREAGSVMDIERFLGGGDGGPLENVNTLANPIVVADQDPTSVPAGHCQLP